MVRCAAGRNYLGGELVVSQSLRSRPLDGKLGACVSSVRVITHQSGQTKVGNLHQMVLPNEAITSSEIPSDNKDIDKTKGEKKNVRAIETETRPNTWYLCMKLRLSK